MKKILPIEVNPPISYNPGVAQPLSILYSGSIKNPDLYLMDRYIQLFYDDFLGGTEKKILAFYIPGENCLGWMNMETVDDDISPDNIISIICQEIKNNFYVQMMLQEYYIPDTIFYKNVQRIHQHLIYGFDDEKRIFYFLCHKQNYRYGTLEVSYDDFLIAFQNRETSPYTYVKIKPNKNVRLKREKDLYIRDSLYDYIYSLNRLAGDSEPTACGLAVYDQLITFMHSGYLDMRDYQALLQHKQVMYIRIKDYLKQSELASQYKAVVNLAIRTHYSALKLSITKQNKIISIIETNLFEMRKLEEHILLEVYNKIKPRKKFFISKKNRKIIVRPYTLESKIKETLPDKEFWDIAEEYFPGARNNSQLSLIYGMSLQNMIGKGHYIGVTPEQEKEFFERIFALPPKE